MKKMRKHGIGNLENMLTDNNLQSDKIGSIFKNIKR